MTENRPFSLNLGGNLIDISTPQVMAIINITPDSFYSGSRFTNEKQILYQVENFLQDGATIIDIGGYSTRPNASFVSEEIEIERVINPLRMIRKAFPDVIISVDTFRSKVAHIAINECGVQIINDISGGVYDENMYDTFSKLNCAYVLMHMRGTPETMQQMTDYRNVTSEVMCFFEQKIAQLISMGQKDIIIDPGFGFAKTKEQNYELLSKLKYFKELGMPILVGISRKSMIYKQLEIQPEDSLNGTSVLNTLALINGANILRVHDVKEAIETIKLVQQYLKTK